MFPLKNTEPDTPRPMLVQPGDFPASDLTHSLLQGISFPHLSFSTMQVVYLRTSLIDHRDHHRHVHPGPGPDHHGRRGLAHGPHLVRDHRGGFVVDSVAALSRYQ